MPKLTLDDIDLSGKRVLMRVDFNVPISPEGKVEDDYRIRAALPSIEKVIYEGGSVVLMSHLGRPKGKVVPELSLKPVAERLSELLMTEVKFSDDCVNSEALMMSSALEPGEVMLLENLRFNKAETENDAAFAKTLAIHGELYINDAFGSAHRAHASTVGITSYHEISVAGYLMEKEVNYLSDLMAEPMKPLMVILGGAKVSDKIPVIRNLSKIADAFIIGGGMAFTFLKAKGLPTGDSLVDDKLVNVCSEIMDELKEKGIELYLPSDCVAVGDIASKEDGEVYNIDELGKGKIGVDIGPMSVAEFDHVLNEAKTVIWNGPMGIFEIPQWSNGTISIGKKLADLTDDGVITIVGGGDSASAMKQMGLAESVTHISTGGGASLELLSNGALPGLDVLQDK